MMIRNEKSILIALHFKFDSLKLMHPAYTCLCKAIFQLNALLFTESFSSGDKYTPLYIFHNKNEAHKANRDLKQIQIKGNTRLTVVLWALLQPPTLGVFCLGQTDLLVAEVEGLLAPVPVKLQDGNEVPDGSDDGEAQDRVNMDPWVLPCAVGESLILQHKDQRRTLSPELHRAY